ncbi:MAG TPA: hypothetical protein VD999_00435 [Vitreimonas sp.]|nr:hypothetical protein [Vitreimonas sp.]
MQEDSYFSPFAHPANRNESTASEERAHKVPEVAVSKPIPIEDPTRPGREVLVCPYPAAISVEEWDKYVKPSDRVAVVELEPDGKPCLILNGPGHSDCYAIAQKAGLSIFTDHSPALITAPFDDKNSTNKVRGIQINNATIFRGETFAKMVLKMVPQERKEAQVKLESGEYDKVIFSKTVGEDTFELKAPTRTDLFDREKMYQAALPNMIQLRTWARKDPVTGHIVHRYQAPGFSQMYNETSPLSASVR